MKVTKFVHSCLLIENEGKTAVIDPGIFSEGSGLTESGVISNLDYIILTHEHTDHLDIKLVKQLVQKFPELQIVTSKQVAVKLQALGYLNTLTENNKDIEMFTCSHEPNEPLGMTPHNIGVHFMQELTDPGDSHHFGESKKILALPLTGPWGMLTRAASIAVELNPKYILPLHDWHWNVSARKEAYDLCEAFFGEKGIKFMKMIDGEPIEI